MSWVPCTSCVAVLLLALVSFVARVWWPSHFLLSMVRLLKFRSELLSYIPQHLCMYDVLLIALNVVAWMLWGMQLLPAMTPVGVLLLSSAFRAILFAVPVCKIQRLPHQASCDKEREFVRIHTNTPDGFNNNSRWIYLRKQAVQQWHALNSCEEVLHVEGPPGTGKSTIAWAWACYQAAFTNVVWVQCDCSGGARICLLVEGSAVLLPGIPADQTHRIRDQMAYCARVLNAHIVIVDGITNAQRGLFGDAAKWANTCPSRRAVLVTSAQLSLQEEFTAAHRIRRFSMASWTWEQYEAACDFAEFFKGVRENLGWTRGHHSEDVTPECKRQLMEEKFHFAGFSARWMFALPIDAVNAAIRNHLRTIADYGTLASAMMGEQNAVVSLHHLFSVDDAGHVFFVSRAVMRALAEITDNESRGVTRATKLASAYHNGAFDGWVFEFKFLLRLRHVCDDRTNSSRQITVTNADGAAECWPVNRRVHLYDATELGCVGDVNLMPNTWYLPTKCNQGGFDAVMVTSPTTLRFVQLTVAKTHSCKLQYLRAFGKTWEKYSNRKLTSVEFVAVVPPKTSFQWQKAESSVEWPINFRTVSFQRAR